MFTKIGRKILAALFRPPEYPDVSWPGGKRFAFTIVDDTDQSTLEIIRPIYDLLGGLGLPITKTTWVFPSARTDEPDDCGDTLSDTGYRNYLIGLQEQGFEIAFHNARGGDNKRAETEAAITKFRELLEHDPKVHVNHFQNRENLYSGRHRLSFMPLRLFYRLFHSWDFEGHVETSPYFWGDLARKHITYVRDVHFNEIDVFRSYSKIPYHDPKRPFVNFWFHASDGSGLESFVNLLSIENLDRLQRSGGLCIVYTHFGKGFCRDGEVNGAVADRLCDVASRDGWFAPVGVILDYLRGQKGDHTISYKDRVYMELCWVLEKAFKGTT